MNLNIENLVSTEVSRQLEEIDLRGIAESEVRKCISNGVGKEIVQSIHSVAKFMIAEEVRKALDAEVVTNDGWGKVQKFSSFEELFRKVFKAEMDAKYEVQKEIQKQVAAKVSELVKQDYKQVIDKIVSEISKSAS